ncbi:MAG: type IV pilin protein [Candidatus Competibacter sp.]|nr:type IV pilin protein [Candidatus Competibacter sp.]
MKPTMPGFTLIELVITVAVIAILAAIAYPSYQDSVRRARRADAQAVLLEAAQWMERFYTANNRYDQNRAGVAVTDATQFPNSGLTKSPKEGGPPGGYYAIALNPAPGQNTFTLTATPLATGEQNKDKCGGLTGPTLNLNQAGAKRVNGLNTPAIIQDCWR